MPQQSHFRLLFAFLALPLPLVLQACQTTGDGNPAQGSAANKASADTPRIACMARTGSRVATLVFRGSQPVDYQRGNFTASDVSRSGNTIYLDQAQYTFKQVSPTTLTGTFVLAGQSTPMTFVCPKALKL